ncbi:MAG: FtsX-like permease family protein [Alteromonadaceae bacterium]|nr:FtsX-like permease family protein [Alteromonadaceae bacterium]
MAIWVKQSLRLLQHELRRGELTIICLAIVLAVATVFSLSGFSSQIKQSLINNSTSFIAADRILQSSSPIEQSILAHSDKNSLNRAEQIQMSSMVFAGDNMKISEIRVISDSYPLRGELLVRKHSGEAPVVEHAPARGTVWVEPSLLKILNLSLGDKIEVGVSTLVIAGIATQIPDASFSLFTSGPNVIVNIDDIAATELIQPGSRLTYKYLFSGDTSDIEAFEKWVKPQVNESQRWYDIKSRQSPLANALNRAEKYLSLASMLGIVLAAVAVAVASRRYSHRHQPTVAVFKAMGASLKHIRKLYLLHWSLLCLFSISLGLVLGFLLLQAGLFAVSDSLPVDTAEFSFYPFIVAVVTGLICAIAFAVAPIKSLIETSPLAVIRGFSELSSNVGTSNSGTSNSFFSNSLFSNVKAKLKRFGWQQLLPISALFALLIMFSGNVVLSLALLLGGLIVALILLGIGRLFMNAGRSMGSRAGKAWHLAMANLRRRASENSVQLVSFTIAIKLLLLILVMKNSLIDDWQQQLPDNTANRFLVNITEQQVTSVGEFIEENNIQASEFYPVVRGRLSSINDEKLVKQVSKEENKASDNGRRGVGRELNLTWRTTLPDKNIITEGQWWSETLSSDKKTDNDAELSGQVSVEQTLAKRLEIKLGDILIFQIGSETVEVPVTSIREVDWQSLQPNFYMIFNSQVLTDFPATYISSLYVKPDKMLDLQLFLIQYPTISMIDVDAMISQLRSVIDQVSVAIEFILVLVVFAGSLVLVAQVQASMEEREREIAILRTLGAKGSLLRASVLYEFLALGAIAGTMASAAMELAVFVLQTQVFDMQASLHPQYWFLGVFVGAGFVGAIGYISCWRLLNMSSVTLIRRTM